MKKILTLVFFVSTISLVAQEKKDYVRSSLHMHLVDDFSFDNGEQVLLSYNKFKFPENYNDHRIDLKKIKLSEYELSDEEKAAAGKKKSLLGEALSDVASETVAASTGGLVKMQDNSMVKLQLDKYNRNNKIAHELIKKWFEVKEDGSFATGLLTTRSLQTQTMEMAAIAGASGTGQVDQFNSLINNTFVVFTRLFYVSNAVAAEVIRQAAYQQAANVPALLQKKAYQAADKIYEKTSEGYSVWTTAWLYKLNWNQEQFDLFVNTLNPETKKIDFEKFYATDFQLEFLSQEKATSLVTFSLKKEDKGRSEQDVFDLSTVRNMDKVLVKLQKKNDVFKPIFPLREDFSLAAGTKEGIDGSETFEVLETKNGKYNRIGTMKIDGKRVWNNSWTGEDIKPDLTYFKKGNKKFVPGIHFVRLVK
tara:strand:+ start:1722 stop:2981 length:1260 start_codon:yes stop_codon:yes gene_type:complete